jgi:predicted Zn-dependent protease
MIHLGQRGYAAQTAAALLLAVLIAAPSAQAAEPAPPLLDAMTAELDRAFSALGHPADGAKQTPPYYLSYTVHDAQTVAISAQFGAVTNSTGSHARSADVQVRVGSAQLDNTHGEHRGTAIHSVRLPLGEDRAAFQRMLWVATNAGYGAALDNFLRVKTESEVRAKEEDSSADFSQEKPQVHVEAPAAPLKVDRVAWEKRVVALSRVLRDYPEVYANQSMLAVESVSTYFASSEGSRIVTPRRSANLVVIAVTRAEDGMDLFQVRTFQAETVEGLPAQAEMEQSVRQMAEQLVALRKAPMTEPFDGPAILSGRAAAVFFHEVLGHRLEGQRQRGDKEGQTFTKELGKPVLPEFLSVADDPTQATFGKVALNGHYSFDSEGQPAQRVELIDKGVLKTFLMSRMPIASFSNSNGHGRAQAGLMPNGRQGNLLVTSTKTAPEAELRTQLMEEAKRQGKLYGLYFEDISSGFTLTQRALPQAFQVIPLVVRRVYVDGRPDELVRGVNIVGTPLAAMKKILVTGDKQELFNGICGAESGQVPVSAVAPALLLSELETQRQPQGSSRPPILPIPQAEAGSGTKLVGSNAAAQQKREAK